MTRRLREAVREGPNERFGPFESTPGRTVTPVTPVRRRFAVHNLSFVMTRSHSIFFRRLSAGIMPGRARPALIWAAVCIGSIPFSSVRLLWGGNGHDHDLMDSSPGYSGRRSSFSFRKWNTRDLSLSRNSPASVGRFGFLPSHVMHRARIGCSLLIGLLSAWTGVTALSSAVALSPKGRTLWGRVSLMAHPKLSRGATV